MYLGPWLGPWLSALLSSRTVNIKMPGCNTVAISTYDVVGYHVRLTSIIIHQQAGRK
jgi:hypothetical protein